MQHTKGNTYSLSYTTANNIALKATADLLESFVIIVMRAILVREIRKCLKR
jgi:hypothetical protein